MFSSQANRLLYATFGFSGTSKVNFRLNETRSGLSGRRRHDFENNWVTENLLNVYRFLVIGDYI